MRVTRPVALLLRVPFMRLYLTENVCCLQAMTVAVMEIDTCDDNLDLDELSSLPHGNSGSVILNPKTDQAARVSAKRATLVQRMHDLARVVPSIDSIDDEECLDNAIKRVKALILYFDAALKVDDLASPQDFERKTVVLQSEGSKLLVQASKHWRYGGGFKRNKKRAGRRKRQRPTRGTSNEQEEIGSMLEEAGED
jgi:hypothetical protein